MRRLKMGDKMNDEKLWSSELIIACTVAGVAIGMLIGILIMCLHRKYACSRNAQPVATRFPNYGLRCYPVNAECGQVENTSPIFAIADPYATCHGANTASSPPAYQSNNQFYLRRQSQNTALSRGADPASSHHRLQSVGEHASNRLSLSDTVDHSFDHGTPESVHRSHHSDQERNRVVGPRNSITNANSQPLPLFAPLPERGNESASGERRSSRNFTLVGSDEHVQSRQVGELIAMQEFHSNGNEPRACLRAAPSLDPNSFIDNTNDDQVVLRNESRMHTSDRHSLTNDHRTSRNSRHSETNGSRRLSNDIHGHTNRRRSDTNNSRELVSGRRSHRVDSGGHTTNNDTASQNDNQRLVNQGFTFTNRAYVQTDDDRLQSPIVRQDQRDRSRSDGATLVGHNLLPLQPSTNHNTATQTEWPSENNLQGDEIDKFKANKQIPFGSMGLPISRKYFMRDDECEIEDLKLFASCPDDLKIIFKPIESSRMIKVRQKLIVYDCKRLDSTGGILLLENMGISLLVPPDAIPHGQSSLVTLILNWDLTDNPPMDKREALISPVVYCGPHSSKFERPCILKFKHCAFDNRCARIMTSETDLFDDKCWFEFGAANENLHVGETQNQNSLDSRGSNVNVTVDECQVEVTHFSLYTCIQRPKNLPMKKWLQVAVFTHDMGTPLRHQSIRVYFLNKTPCALQWAMQNEETYGFRLACPENVFLFEECGEDMAVRLQYLSKGWSMVSKEAGRDDYSNVMFEQIWHGACPHICMCFKRTSSSDENLTTTNPRPTSGQESGARVMAMAMPDVDFANDDRDNSNSKQIASVPHRNPEQELRKEDDATVNNSEIFICLKLSQVRCDNVSTNVNVLMYDSTSTKVSFSQDETLLKTAELY